MDSPSISISQDQTPALLLLSKKARQAERSRKHYEAHKEKMIARAKQWKAENPGKVAASGKTYRAKVRPELLEKKKAFYAANKVTESAKRRAYKAIPAAENLKKHNTFRIE